MTTNLERENWKHFLEYVPGGMFQCYNDEGFTLVWVSQAFCELTGYTSEEIKERYDNQFIKLVWPEDRKRIPKVAHRTPDSKNDLDLEYRLMRKDGSLLWVMEKGKCLEREDGKSTFLCLLMDITVRKKAEEELRLSLERYQAIMAQTTDIIFEWDMERDTLFLSANWEKKFGYHAIDRQISRLLPESPNIHNEDLGALTGLMEDMRQGKTYAEAEFRIANAMGEFIWCRLKSTAQHNEENQPFKAVGVILDIENEKRQQQELLREAHQDGLTGLLNKSESKRRIEHLLSLQDGYGSLLVIDLDDFKNINDKYGHLCGDAVLSDTASVLRKLTRPRDVIGRIGGDEFLIYLPDTDKKSAGQKALEISLNLKEKQLPDPGDILRISVGIAGWPEDAENFFDLYHKADLALYYSKDHGKDYVSLYDEKICAVRDSDHVTGRIKRTVIESEDLTDVDEQLISYTFHMLYHSQNTEEAVNQLLEIVGRAYDVSRVYIFENSPDGKCCNNTFEWCNEGIAPQKDILQNLSYEEDLDGYVSNFDGSGVFYCEDIQKLQKKLYDILAPQGVKSMLQCAIIDDQEFNGYVGFDECRNNRYWTKEQIKSLGLIANILSEFLIKYRLKEQVKRLMEK